jgi:hypothetical protein
MQPLHNHTLTHPLDAVEALMLNRSYAYERPSGNALVAELLCSWCDVRLWCSWQPEAGILLFSWGFGSKIAENLRTPVCQLLALTNERTVLGHFDLSSAENLVSFRYSLSTTHAQPLTCEQLEPIMDRAMQECERFYPALQAVLWAQKRPEEAIALMASN